jgi:GNAT superfamily N-acetyltransferase
MRVEPTKPMSHRMQVARPDLPAEGCHVVVPGAATCTGVDHLSVMPESTLMARSLKGLYPTPPDWAMQEATAGVRIGSLRADPGVLTELELECRPAGHVDRDRALSLIAAGSFRRLLTGELIGPVLETASGQAEDDDSGKVLGMGIVVWWERADLWHGPWVADICVRPAHQGRGIGTALLKRALVACAAMGASRIGLAVTEGNPARTLYERLGFIPF